MDCEVVGVFRQCVDCRSWLRVGSFSWGTVHNVCHTCAMGRRGLYMQHDGEHAKARSIVLTDKGLAAIGRKPAA